MSENTSDEYAEMKRLQLESARAARWAKTQDRKAEMAPAHAGRDLAIAKKYGVVDYTVTVEGFAELRKDAAIAKRFESARKAHYTDIARRSVAARLKAKRALAEAEQAEAELEELDGE